MTQYTQEQDKMREAFEAWHTPNHKQSLERYGDTYHNVHVRDRWRGWQAASAQAVPQGWRLVPADLDDDIGEAIAKAANCCGGIAYDIWIAALAAAPQPEAQAAPQGLSEAFAKFDNYANGFKDGHREARHAAAPLDAKQAVQMPDADKLMERIRQEIGRSAAIVVLTGQRKDEAAAIAAKTLEDGYAAIEQQVRAMLATPAAPVLQPLALYQRDAIKVAAFREQGNSVWYDIDAAITETERAYGITGAPNAD